MTFQAAVRKGLSGYFAFEGRASRSEFWWFNLFAVLVIYVIPFGIYLSVPATSRVVGIAITVLILGLYLPLLTVSVRRLHDRNRSGLHYLWVFAPFFGPIMLLIWFCRRGTTGENRFGPDPLPMSHNVAEVF
jgi:uncharacterized membrane protein YhaH (DUF805 family)